MSIYENLFLYAKSKKPAYVVLLDPDKLTEEKAAETSALCSSAGVDAFFVGGSTVSLQTVSRITKVIKESSSIPVILFPGGADQIVSHADAILFMSLLSGRNPRYLVEEPLKGVPLIKSFGLETIGMGYLLIESDKPSAVQRVSGTTPLSRTLPEEVVNHALMAQYFGMKAVYLEGGSGVSEPVPVSIIGKVRKAIDIPLIVGGGLKTPATIRERIIAGADIIVTGNVLEQDGAEYLLKEFVAAVNNAR